MSSAVGVAGCHWHWHWLPDAACDQAAEKLPGASTAGDGCENGRGRIRQWEVTAQDKNSVMSQSGDGVLKLQSSAHGPPRERSQSSRARPVQNPNAARPPLSAPDAPPRSGRDTCPAGFRTCRPWSQPSRLGDDAHGMRTQPWAVAATVACRLPFSDAGRSRSLLRDCVTVSLSQTQRVTPVASCLSSLRCPTDATVQSQAIKVPQPRQPWTPSPAPLSPPSPRRPWRTTTSNCPSSAPASPMT